MEWRVKIELNDADGTKQTTKLPEEAAPTPIGRPLTSTLPVIASKCRT